MCLMNYHIILGNSLTIYILQKTSLRKMSTSWYLCLLAAADIGEYEPRHAVIWNFHGFWLVFKVSFCLYTEKDTF